MIRTCHISILFAVLFVFTCFALQASPSKTTVTAGRLEYDFDAASVYFEKQVKVEDPEFRMTSDKAVVFLRNTNEVAQVKASGKVVVINGDRTARCNAAVYTKDARTIVMYAEKKGDPMRQVYLKRIIDGKDDVLYADKITIWLDSQRVECEPVRIILDGSNPVSGADKKR